MKSINTNRKNRRAIFSCWDLFDHNWHHPVIHAIYKGRLEDRYTLTNIRCYFCPWWFKLSQIWIVGGREQLLAD